ncbi:transcriptional regulator GlxA family with amidase domain [Paraburkholderia caballeronis]|nr:transcriptional regulator GlxA family with amidase domain [Paraburkholderia caballeronis]TDV20193.1 transcriptional regulator GlxA family with amidase domain [Paraburkholderia caballeronis]TDV28410.1 transcriptional regulator GlxA family with amidase domain [Paraburkholderia caballeronis]
MRIDRVISRIATFQPRDAIYKVPHLARRIGILVFDAFPLSDVSLLADVFRLANETHAGRFGGAPPVYSLVMLSELGGSVASSCSLRIWTESLHAPLMNGFDTLFIAGGPGAIDARRNERLIARLRAIAPKIRVIRALGEGRAVLARIDASFLRGGLNPAAAALRLRRSMPSQEVGSAAVVAPSEALVAALKLVKRDHGVALAQQISEHSAPGAWDKLGLVLDDGESETANSKINTAAHWLRENYHQPISVADAARVAQMSMRNFLRHFKTQTGLTPSEYLLRARLDASCTLLAQTDLPIDEIAQRCGVPRGDRLARIFRRRLSISPSDYRAVNQRGDNEK